MKMDSVFERSLLVMGLLDRASITKWEALQLNPTILDPTEEARRIVDEGTS